jgi:hypothetical protein
MSTSKSKAAKPIKGMENGEGVKTVASRTDDQNSGQVGGRSGGVLVERKFQRRNNITNLPGLIREHARLIALIRNGEIPLDRGEILSRAMGRHKEMVTALEERNQLKAIVEQLRALRGDPSPQLMIDESKEPAK